MNPNIDLITLLGIAVTSISLFLVLFYLIKNKLKNDGYVFLYFSIFILSCELLYKTLIHSRLIYDYIIIYNPGRFFNLLIYPIFLFFILSITNEKFKLKLPQWLLLILFIGLEVSSLYNTITYETDKKTLLLDLFYNNNSLDPYNYWVNLKTIIKSTLIPVLFLSIIGFEFFRFKRKKSSIQNKRLFNILSFIIILYFLFYQFANLYFLFYQSGNIILKWGLETIKFTMFELPIDIVFLSIINILFSVLVLSVNSGSTFLPPVKYIGSSLDTRSYEKIISKVQKHLQEDQLYKNEKITLTDLSKKLNINPKYLSQSINHCQKISFVDFINQYRVEEAKKQLLNEKNKHLTLEAIGNLSGFKSKTSFFRAFKKATNTTPNKYIKLHKKSTYS